MWRCPSAATLADTPQHPSSMRARLLLPVLLALAATGSSATAQDAPPDRDEAGSRWSRFAVLAAGAAANGPSARVLLGSEARLSRQFSIGLTSRFAAARGPYPVDGTEKADDLYAEFGLSLRPSLRLSERVQVAASAGYGLTAVVISEADGSGHAANDLGFTLPLEAEASLRLGRSVGATVGVSRSVALESYRTVSMVLPTPEVYDLDHWMATVGVRIGRW